MNRMQKLSSSFLATLIFSFCFVLVTSGQTPTPQPTLPPGMTGSNTSDPRANLSAGLYDAGEHAFGMKHLQLLKKPDAFRLDTSDPNDPMVKKVLAGYGITDTSKIPA